MGTKLDIIPGNVSLAGIPVSAGPPGGPRLDQRWARSSALGLAVRQDDEAVHAYPRSRGSSTQSVLRKGGPRVFSIASVGLSPAAMSTGPVLRRKLRSRFSCGVEDDEVVVPSK